MTLMDIYERLQNGKPTLDEIRAFKDQALGARDANALKKGDILLADYYIGNGNPQSALDMLRKSLDETSPQQDPENYRALLDRAIYASISCKDYQQATRLLSIKKGLLDTSDAAAVNRWYMESAYAAALMNQKSRALSAFKAILTNNPTPDVASLVLGNMTKLLLDEGNAQDARKTLNEAIAASTELKDADALRYCDYLSVKLAVLENDNAFARDGFAAFFKDVDPIPQDYLEFYNEYIDFLLKTGDVALATRLAQKEKEHILAKGDKYLRREFLLTLVALALKKAKNEETAQALASFIELDKEITAEDYSASEEIVTPLPAGSAYATLAVEFKTFQNALSEREEFPFLLNAFQRIDDAFGPLEAQAVFFDLSVFDPLHVLADTRGVVKTASYKARRCYVRDLPFASLAGSVFEEELDGGKVISGRISEGNVLKDPLTGATLSEEGYQELAVFPLLDRGKVYGALAFLYKLPVGLSKSRKDSLEVISSLYSLKMASLSLAARADDAEAFLATALHGQTDGLFFLDPVKGIMTLSQALAQDLGMSETRTSRISFLEGCDLAPDEASRLSSSLVHDEAYEIHYALHRADGTTLPLIERALPVRLTNRTVYTGTITLERVNESASTRPTLSERDLAPTLSALELRKGDAKLKVTFLAFTLAGLPDVFPLSTREALRRTFESSLSASFPTGTIIARNDGTYQVIIADADQRELEHATTLLASALRTSSKGEVALRCGLSRYPRDGRDLGLLAEASLALSARATAASRAVAVFSEEFKRDWLADQEEEQALKRILASGKVTFLTHDLVDQASMGVGKLLTYDIPGLPAVRMDFPRVSPLLDRTDFAKLVFRALMKQSLSTDLYWPVSSRVLHELCLTDYFSPADKAESEKIVIVCTGTLPKEEDAVRLHGCGFRLALSLSLFSSASLSYLSRVPFVAVLRDEEMSGPLARLLGLTSLVLLSEKN